jgi:hypothetical protein
LSRYGECVDGFSEFTIDNGGDFAATTAAHSERSSALSLS